MERKIFKFKSLEDFVLSRPLNIDGVLNDGGFVYFPVKGVEINATILFADIRSFSSQTVELNSTEMFIYLNHFLTWISAEALYDTTGIVDKYVGDEIAIVFSEEFGSENSFEEALTVAKRMAHDDVFSFMPRIGIASGEVTIGYFGTPLKYDCSVTGLPVTIAKRCSDLVPENEEQMNTFINFPKQKNSEFIFEKLFPPEKYGDFEMNKWEFLTSRNVDLKNIGNYDIHTIVKKSYHIPSETAEQRAKNSLEGLKKQGFYRKIKKNKL